MVHLAGTPRERFRDHMRQEILDAARRILREQGIKELSMRGLAQAVGSSPATIYDYFESKDGVLDALFAVGTERLRDAFEEGFAANEPGIAQLRHIAMAYRAFAHDEPDLFQLIFGRVDRAYRPAVAVKAQAEVLFQMLMGAVKEATIAGHVRPISPDMAALSIWAAVHGFVTLEVHGFVDDCTPAEADFMFDESLRILFEGLGQERSSLLP
jgi:AcrR family transcriptional regulator